MAAKSVKKNAKGAVTARGGVRPGTQARTTKPSAVIKKPLPKMRPQQAEVAAAERLAAQVEDVVVVRTEARVEPGHAWRQMDVNPLDTVREWLWKLGLGKVLGTGRTDMTTVKEGVMAELRHMRQGKQEVTGSSPFSSVLLPERVKPRRKDALRWFVAVSVLLILALFWLGGRSPATPDEVVAKALAAARGGHAEKVMELVDVNALSADVVDQVMAAPTVDMKSLPEALQDHLQRDLKARMEAMIKPGLADKMAQQIGELVEAKRAPVPDDGLLYQVWEDLGGDAIEVGKPVVVGESDHAAIVALPIDASDVSGMLEIALAREAEGGWKIVGIPNLSQVLISRNAERGSEIPVAGTAATVTMVEIVPPVPLATKPMTAMAERELENPEQVVGVRDIIKGKQGNDALVVRAVMDNKSGVEVQRVAWAVLFADAAGVPMLEIPLELTGEIPAGASREQVWTVPLDQGNPKARYVRDLPQGSLKVSGRVLRVIGPSTAK